MPAPKDYKAEARRRAADRAQSAWYKLKEGDNTFRILPTPESKTTQPLWMEYALHREVGPKKTQVRCGKSVPDRDGHCWLCDVKIPALRKAGKESRAAALEPKDVFVIQVAKVSEDDGKMTGPLLFSPSAGVANQILTSVIGSKKRAYEDPKKGYNLTLNRTGTGRNDTRYGMIEPDSDPSVVPGALVEKLKPFSELKEIPAYNEGRQKAAYEGRDFTEGDADDEEEEDEKPKSKKGKAAPPPSKSKKSKDDEEEEEEEDEEEADESDDEEEDDADESEEEEDDEEESEDEDDSEEDGDEEEEDEAPVKKKGKPAPPKKKSKAAPPEDEEEEEEEDDESEEDDEEEEEEAPKSKKGSKSKKKKPANDEEEEEDEDDENLDDLDDEEDEEEDEAPSPKKKSKPATLPPPKKKKK